MDSNALDCPVCLLSYETDSSKRPRVLPCGHSFCTSCMDELKHQGLVTCPTCRKVHTLPEEGRFPVSYGLEAVLKSMKNVTSSSEPFKPQGYPEVTCMAESDREEWKGLSKAVKCMLLIQESNLVAAIHACQKVKSQLDHYRTTLAGWEEKQQLLEERLQALVDESRDARLLVREEEARVLGKKQELDEGEGQLQLFLQAVRQAAMREHAYQAIDNADQGIEEDKHKREGCLAMFPDVNIITTINKVMDVSKAALTSAANIEQEVNQTLEGVAGSSSMEQASQQSVGAAARSSTIKQAAQHTLSSVARDHSLPAPAASSIVDRVHSLISSLVKVENLRRLTWPIKDLLQRGLVYGVHTMEEGGTRYARITLEDNTVYLHCLKEQPLPRGAVTLQVDELVRDKPPCLMFLDLVWPGSGAPRRVVIRLTPDTPRGRQFVMLCVGQRGPCYAGTKLVKIYNKRQPGERIYGGDYERGDGEGGEGLLPHLDEGNYRGGTHRAGDVFPAFTCNKYYESAYNARGAQFGIVTKDNSDGEFTKDCVFGSVVSGLDVVEAAAQHHTITQVTIANCGAILWRQ